MNNTRFATALHILTLLASYPEEWLSSDYIAGSININPVMVRKELIFLNDAGLVESKKGKEGGVRLAKTADSILLSDVLRVVKNSEVLGKKNQKPNSNCPIGRQINDKLDELFSATDELVNQSLSAITLTDFCHRF
jgi:transcriptional regulator, BadM/Rrf2 family